MIRRMRFEYCISNATQHSEYTILTAFVLQKRLKERASLLRHSNIDCLVKCVIWRVVLREDRNAGSEKKCGKKLSDLDVGKIEQTGYNDIIQLFV